MTASKSSGILAVTAALVAASLSVCLGACSSGTSNGTGGTNGTTGTNGEAGADAASSESAPGSDCLALRDKQAAANCPQFDPAKYLVDYEDTERKLPASCKAQFHALATCVLGQPVGCTASGGIEDSIPACDSQDEALSTCPADSGK